MRLKEPETVKANEESKPIAAVIEQGTSKIPEESKDNDKLATSKTDKPAGDKIFDKMSKSKGIKKSKNKFKDAQKERKDA
jgi:hypothetical protein